MSIMLKGVDVPIYSNEECVVVIKKNKAEVLQTGYKKRTVEVIQIPKDHGRLIDGDKLIERLKSDNPQTSKIKYMSIVAECAPTILEAERED